MRRGRFKEKVDSDLISNKGRTMMSYDDKGLGTSILALFRFKTERNTSAFLSLALSSSIISF